MRENAIEDAIVFIGLIVVMGWCFGFKIVLGIGAFILLMGMLAD